MTMPDPNRPLLSFIIPARNDDFMDNFQYRFETTLNYLAANAANAALLDRLEVLICDWGSETPLWKRLNLSSQAKRIVRYLIVPPAIALVEQKDSVFPIVLAQNAAIRRARGEFIMQTDSDVLISADFLDKLFQFFMLPVSPEGDIRKTFIFAQRRHIPWSVVSTCPQVEVLENYALANHDELHLDSNEEFPFCATGTMGMHRDLWFESTGYDERLIHWGWMEIDLGLRLTTRYPYLNLTPAADMTIYHLEHYKGSTGHYSGRKVERQINPMDRNNAYAANGINWGLISYPLESYEYGVRSAAHTI